MSDKLIKMSDKLKELPPNIAKNYSNFKKVNLSYSEFPLDKI